MASSAYPSYVNLVRAFLDRWHKLIREFAKFGVIGVVNTVIDFGLFNLLQQNWQVAGHHFLLHGAPLKATVVATTVSATTSYFMNRHWTFRHRERSGLTREYMLFFVFNGIGLAIQLGMLGAAKYGFGINSLFWLNWVKVAGVGIGTVFRFWTYQTWVFRHPEDAIYATEGDPVDALDDPVEVPEQRMPAELADPR
jgi:putative flippase GtrA